MISWAIIKILEHSNLDSLEAKRNHCADISTRNATFKGTNNSQTSVMIQRNTFAEDYLEKLDREAQELALE